MTTAVVGRMPPSTTALPPEFSAGTPPAAAPSKRGQIRCGRAVRAAHPYGQPRRGASPARRFLPMLLLLSLLCGMLSSCTKKQTRHTASFYAMDTVILVTLYTPDADLAERQLARCRELLAELDGLWSRHTAGSDVWRLNQSADGLCDLDPRTVSLLAQAKEISLATGGAFDPTLAPLSDLWQACGAQNRLPGTDELAALLALTGADRLQIGSSADGTQTAVSRPAGMQIDPGGIGKGAAVSMLIEELEGSGVTGGLVSFGSSVAVFGTKPDGTPFRVALRDPQDAAGTVGELNLPAGAVLSVSGDYERYVTIGGQRYQHILDPETGMPAESGLSSVAVVCSDGALADALSTALFVMGAEASMQFYETGTYEFEAIMIAHDGTMTTTPGLTGFG